MSAAGKVRLVGVDLQDTEETRALVDAIEADNPDAALLRMPGIVKIQAPGQLVIRRESVEARMGREWETHEFQLSIVSYSGSIETWDDDEIVIKWEH
ncbi:MmoB/DmpM family protein [Pseudonocardia sp.]|uniref:MmoB/DmpM family protein n=1 Tax=Pseudonocardia sp. TaxID=60912 RepID=UPI003D0E86A9